MKIPRIANVAAHKYAADLLPFQGSNLRGEWSAGGRYYVVYSYRTPLLVWDDHLLCWFQNSNWLGPTTSRHRRNAVPRAPSGSPHIYVETECAPGSELRLWLAEEGTQPTPPAQHVELPAASIDVVNVTTVE